MSRIRIALIVITVAAGIFCASVIAGTLVNWNPDILRGSMLATSVTSTVSAVGWLVLLLFGDESRVRDEYRRREAALIMALSQPAARHGAPTEPQPRLYSV